MPLPPDPEEALALEKPNVTAGKIRTLLCKENEDLEFYTIDPAKKLATAYLTKVSVKEALSLKSLKSPLAQYAEPDDDLVQYALGDARTLFLMVVYHFGKDRGGTLRLAMEKLKAAGLDDKSLFPIQELRKSHRADAAVPGTSNTASDSEDLKDETQVLMDHKLGRVDPDIFDRAMIGEFYDDQWKFPGRVPVFSTSTEGTNLSIHCKCVLPLLKKIAATDVRHGSFGEVSRVWIHPAHIDDRAQVVSTERCM